MASRKEFATTVVAEMSANPRKYLAGHGIGGIMLKKMGRSDVLFRIGGMLYSFKTFKRGAIALKKSNLLSIKAYKNLPELKKKAALDIEKFQAGLKGTDAQTFSNATNVVCIVAVDRKKLVAGPEGDDVEMGIATDASYTMPFEDAINSRYKIPGTWFVVVMFADSLKLNREELMAKRRAKREKAKAKRERGNAAKIKAKLKRQLSIAKEIESRLSAIDDELAATNSQLAQIQLARQQQNALRAQKGNFEVNAYKKLEQIRKKKSAIRKKIQQLQLDLSLAPASKVRSIKSMISSYKNKYEQLKAAEKRVKGYNVDKSEIVAKLRAKTEKLMARGESLRSALNKATASIAELTPQQKQQVRQQIAMQVADGVPPVFAQQAAIQQLDLTTPAQNQYAQNVSAQDIIDALDNYAPQGGRQQARRQQIVDDVVDDIDDELGMDEDDNFNLQDLINSL